ncbi:MAG: (d)CMP kinase [Fimbriimonadaceae bacterium]|nr:(d)CMP kinase [Fimbriimonadaceae bacterium]
MTDFTNITIAIDGPAGAGKSTVAKALCAELGMRLLDTGAMYRCIALKAQRLGLSAEDKGPATDLAKNSNIEFQEGEPQRVILDGEDVTDAIRTLEIGQLASALSTYGPLRAELVKRQQEIIAHGGYILEGRDVTTVVAPNAEVKIFLTASIEERARRRWLEMRSRNDQNSTLQEVVKDVVQRDHRDYSRDESPLTLAEDAIILESFGLAVSDVVNQIRAIIRAKIE